MGALLSIEKAPGTETAAPCRIVTFMSSRFLVQLPAELTATVTDIISHARSDF